MRVSQRPYLEIDPAPSKDGITNVRIENLSAVPAVEIDIWRYDSVARNFQTTAGFYGPLKGGALALCQLAYAGRYSPDEALQRICDANHVRRGAIPTFIAHDVSDYLIVIARGVDGYPYGFRRNLSRQPDGSWTSKIPVLNITLLPVM
jgi:hypothetical protein